VIYGHALCEDVRNSSHDSWKIFGICRVERRVQWVGEARCEVEALWFPGRMARKVFDESRRWLIHVAFRIWLEHRECQANNRPGLAGM
jgi:hypothetical protein